MSFRTVFVFIISSFWCFHAFAEECATLYSELKKTQNLQVARSLFNPEEKVGFINDTKGSYIVLEVQNDKLMIHFYTSGIFDLYAIKKEGPLTLCDEGNSLKMVGLERSEKLKISDGRLELGDGGPRKSFLVGNMPDSLKRLHHIDTRNISSEH